MRENPVFANSVPSQSWPEGKSTSFTFAANTFTDAEGDPISYSIAMSNGTTLPSWISLISSTRTITGTPPIGTPNISIRIWSKDPTHVPMSFVDVIIGTP